MFFLNSNRIPGILLSMGYTDLHAQLLITPPYLTAFVSVILNGYLCDRFNARIVIMVVSFLFQIAGYLGMMLLSDINLKYASAVIACIGIYTPYAPLMSWCTNAVHGNSTKTAILTALVVACGNCGGIINSFLFPKANAPNHVLGNRVLAGFAATGIFGIALQTYLLKRERKFLQDSRL